MFRKWYIELALILAVLALTVFIVFKADFCRITQSIQMPQAEPTSSADTSAPLSKSSLASQQWKEGRSIFISNCAACHNPKADGTGPPLMGVTDRWSAAGKYKGKTGLQWMNVWVKNWREAVDAGYPYAVAMANSRSSEMNVFINLTDKNIEDIMFYVNRPDVAKVVAAGQVLY